MKTTWDHPFPTESNLCPWSSRVRSCFSSVRHKSAAPVTAPAVPAGKRVYAIGDVHGRADLLATLLDHNQPDFLSGPTREDVLLFIGDYIDRGPSSSDVVDIVLRTAQQGNVVALRGNHEA